MVLNNGANVNTTAALLGHSDLQYIKRYVRATDTEKKAALNSLPPIKLK
jgi:site-specific recombinase XerD